MTLLFIMTLLSGPGSLSSSVPRQSHVVKEQKTWEEAQQYCRKEFTDLATIDDMTEKEMVKSLIHDAGVSPAWIGLKQGATTKWQWSLADRNHYKENDIQFINWAKNQPDDGEEYCGVQDGGKWHDYFCRGHFSFICYNGGNSTHYVLVTNKKNWTEAQKHCRETYTDLASVRNQIENDEIHSVIGHGPAWIGLFRDAWEWSDGSNSSFRLWESGVPSLEGVKNCTQVHTNGQWSRQECSDPLPFICYEDKLVLVRENKTWNEALRHCREHYGDLLSVPSHRVQRWVKERAKGASTAHVWLGLRYSCSLAFWFWVSGETVGYSYWGSEEEGQGCVEGFGAMESGGQQSWVSLTETHKLNFICTTEAPKEMKTKMKVIVRFQIESKESMDDPSVQQALLQQIQQRLIDGGMPADTKLTWNKQPDGKIFKEKKERRRGREK